jgi:hypothetical protein
MNKISKVICSGMMRSGSTWSFNIVRLIMQEMFGNVHTTYANYDDIDKVIARLNGLAVIKAHFPSKKVVADILDSKVMNVFTARDPRDCYVSRRAFQGNESKGDSLRLIKNSELYATAFLSKPETTLFVMYENIVCNPIREIQRIGEYLGCEITQDGAENLHAITNPEAVKELTSGFDGMAGIYKRDGHKVYRW